MFHIGCFEVCRHPHQNDSTRCGFSLPFNNGRDGCSVAQTPNLTKIPANTPSFPLRELGMEPVATRYYQVGNGDNFPLVLSPDMAALQVARAGPLLPPLKVTIPKVADVV